nr:MAG TPA: hypothetical protein [Bacteriophage sp.]
MLGIAWLTTRCLGHLYDPFLGSRPLTGIIIPRLVTFVKPCFATSMRTFT